MAITKSNASKPIRRLPRKISCSLSRPRSVAVVLFFLCISLRVLCSSTFITTLASQASIFFSSLNPIPSMRQFLVFDSQDKNLGHFAASGRSLGMSERFNSDWSDRLSSCDLFDGSWVVDDEYPIYKAGSCPFVDSAFDCFKNGRPDSGFAKLRWRPRSCDISRFNGTEMLMLLRGKRLVFVGDSLNRNMWESLICAIRASLGDSKKMVAFKTPQGFYSFKFKDYNCSIDFFRSPFLVKEIRRGSSFEKLRLDMIHEGAEEYSKADILVFNSGHWWTHSKTKRGKNFFQEGDHIYASLPAIQAYTKAMRTWANWVDANIDSNRTRVFFRGYSASHFRGGQWNSGGNCHGETQPEMNKSRLAPYRPMMTRVVETLIDEMKTPVFYLNITKMTAYRKDGHPSIFRPRKASKPQDCSHWCLPGVPDSWNELLYAALLMS